MRVPTSTYRLQITEDFDLLDAARRLSYLRQLGVDWVYVSPVLASESGSAHGYDVSDHRSVDPSRGRGSGLSALAAEAHRLGMGVLVDIVPNHVGVARPWENEWWWHVLTHGQQSAFASAFDIDWVAGGGKVRIPVVSDDDLLSPTAEGRPSLIAGLEVMAGELHYRDNRYPLAPGTAENVEEDPNLVHARQHYELVSWRRADRELNYRRFFAVSTLVAIKVEDPEWFARSHAEIKRWFDEGLVDGLRIDHPDGLRDPRKYLDDLAALTKGAYVLVEKILEPGEELPRNWATSGTTGYDALAMIDRVLIDPAGRAPLDALEGRLRGAPVDWAELTHQTKRAAADGILNSEVRRIASELSSLLGPAPAASPTTAASAPGRPQPGSAPGGSTAPITARPAGVTTAATAGAAAGSSPIPEREVRPPAPSFEQLVDAVAEALACFPVYRSYLPEGREHLDAALARARAQRPDLADVIDRIAPILADGAAEPAQRFQQTSGMVMAKGVEDCAFYRWARLTALNEVGGDPSVFSATPEEFHAAMARRQAEWPNAMTAATTHDTKRGEDVRARVSVLAEIPDVWQETLSALLALAPMPEPGFGNLLWQAIVGAWPSQDQVAGLRSRLHDYARKAMREAGQRTGWIAVDSEYEAVVQAAVDAAFDDARVRSLVTNLVDRIAAAGWSNALSAKLLCLCVPGVPDVYQGSELWEQSLVDPDNRRPVDFAVRTRALGSLRAGERPGPVHSPDDPGIAKLLLTHVALTQRRDHPELFTTYHPLAATGSAAEHALAFDRGGAISVATRLPVGLAAAGGWGDTRLQVPPGTWVDLLTGRRHRGNPLGALRLAEVLADYPVALLVRATRGSAGGHGRFDVWAPRAQAVQLRVADRKAALERATGRGEWTGWWRLVGPEPLGEVDYGYLLELADGHMLDELPDPRSRRQPHGGRAPSRTFDPTSHTWTDQAWTGRQLAGCAIYELEVATFTAAGTLDAASERLGHVLTLGVDVIALTPVNWSPAANGEPEGVGWFAIAEQYGGPAAYQRFVDACHRAGLAVIQEVVYDTGPAEFLSLFGPYRDATAEDPAGGHLNVAGPGSSQVRAHVLANVRMWFEEFHVDGLRVAGLSSDRGQYLADPSQPHLFAEIARAAACLSAHLRRPLTVMADSDANDPHLTTPANSGGYGLDARCGGEFRHALYLALTAKGRDASLAGRRALAKAVAEGCVADRPPAERRSSHRPPITEAVPAWRRVVSNRDRGGQPAELLADGQLACAALLTLTGPFTPMLLQGEEWAASNQVSTPQPAPDAGLVVSQGQNESQRFGSPEPPSPHDLAHPKLDWTELETGPHALLLRVYRELGELRRQTPQLTDPDLEHTTCEVAEAQPTFVMRRGELVVVVNFGTEPVTLDLAGEHEVRWATPARVTVEGTRVALPPHAGAVLTPLT